MSEKPYPNKSTATIAWHTCFEAIQRAKELIESWEKGSPSGFADAMQNLHKATGEALSNEFSFQTIEIYGDEAIEAEFRRRKIKGLSE